ncbi:MAG: hypothetical protein HUU55_02645 [Myxococcales bacterium]|nr:hypothetical protein [Myxococcales bacterium]
MNTTFYHRWLRITWFVTCLAMGMLLLGGAKKGCTKIEPQQPICDTPVDCEGLAKPDCIGEWSCELGECKFNCTPQETTCFGDSDCADGQACDFSVCKEPTSSNCAPGAPCPFVIACMGVCKDGPPPTGECQQDSDCAADQVCNVTCSGCACLPGQPCDCAAPECTGQCVPKTDPLACYSDADCKQGYSCVCKPISSCPNCLVACIGECIPQPPSDNQWWVSCGTPVCGGYTPKPGIPACKGQNPGEACFTPGGQCDLVGNTCNQTLICTNYDPTLDGCPKSQVESKTAIRIIDNADKTRVYETLQSLPLASYTYKDDPNQTMRLGFLIGHGGPQDAVLPSGERVDLYAYTSMAIAALQAQAQEIDRLKTTVQTLTEQVDALKAKAAK